MSSISTRGKTHVTHQQIEQRAYEIYLERDGAEGTDDWLVAERELLGEQDRPGISQDSTPPLSSRGSTDTSASADAEEARNIKPRGRSAAAGDRSVS